MLPESSAEVLQAYGGQCSLVSKLENTEPKVEVVVLGTEGHSRKVWSGFWVLLLLLVVCVFVFILFFFYYYLPFSDQLYVLLKATWIQCVRQATATRHSTF